MGTKCFHFIIHMQNVKVTQLYRESIKLLYLHKLVWNKWEVVFETTYLKEKLQKYLLRTRWHYLTVHYINWLVIVKLPFKVSQWMKLMTEVNDHHQIKKKHFPQI